MHEELATHGNTLFVMQLHAHENLNINVDGILL